MCYNEFKHEKITSIFNHTFPIFSSSTRQFYRIYIFSTLGFKMTEPTSELEKLIRRNKILTRRNNRLNEDIQKLSEENDELWRQIEELKAIKAPRKKNGKPKDYCPKCGENVEILIAGPNKITLCKNKNCNFKKSEIANG